MADEFLYWLNEAPVLFPDDEGDETFLYWLDGAPVVMVTDAISLPVAMQNYRNRRNC